MTSTSRSIFFTRYIGYALLAASALIAAPAQANVSDYPSRSIKVFFPWLDGFPANSARLYAEKLSERVQQPVLVDVKSGAGGEVAARQLLNAPNDGYSLLATGSSITIRSVVDERNVDGLRDLQPLGRITTTPYVLLTRAGRFGSVESLVAEAKASPGTLNFASAGVGTGMHYLGELINDKAGIEIVHIPYSTGSQQLLALNSGDVEVAIISLVTALPHIKAGVMEALAVSSVARSQALPDVPTLAESGIHGVPDLGAWIAFFGPRDMPQDVVSVLSEHIQAISQEADVQALVASWGGEVPDASVGALDQTIRTEKASWESVIRQLE